MTTTKEFLGYAKTVYTAVLAFETERSGTKEKFDGRLPVELCDKVLEALEVPLPLRPSTEYEKGLFMGILSALTNYEDMKQFESRAALLAALFMMNKGK